MRKLAVAVAVALLVGSSAWAAGTIKDNCGCGFGNMALGDNDPTLISQLGATCLNGFLGSQTFGITSGTLGCDKYEGFASNKQIQEFVTDNMDQLVMDMAKGQGNSLDALADLMNVAPNSRPELYGRLQSHFGDIFTSENVTASEVIQNIAKVAQS